MSSTVVADAREHWQRSRYFTPGSQPIAPIPAQTTYVDAGPIVIGLEKRVLTSGTMRTHLRELGVERQTGHGATPLDREFTDGGWSIHVFDDNGAEYLRFDCFDEDPHYHYLVPGLGGVVKYGFDPIANGDPLTWVLTVLQTRIEAMLGAAGAPDLADAVDHAALGSAIARLCDLTA